MIRFDTGWLDALGRLWTRPVAFERDWRLSLGLGFALGTLVVFVIVFLEPWGTRQYQAPWRVLRLSGYGVCVLVPVLLAHGLDLLRVRGRHWRFGDELISKLIMTIMVSTMTYLYATLVINRTTPSWSGMLDWTVYIVVPVFVVVSLPLVVLRRRLIRAIERRRDAAETVTVVGRNREDRVALPRDGFVCAEARQNYVVLHFVAHGQEREHMIRAPLNEVEGQLQGSLRVHRSWLINPRHVQEVSGRSRARRIRLRGFSGSPIPVSPAFDTRLLGLSELH